MRLVLPIQLVPHFVLLLFQAFRSEIFKHLDLVFEVVDEGPNLSNSLLVRPLPI